MRPKNLDAAAFVVVQAVRATNKLDLVCEKISLQRDAELLDIGCGWGTLTLHAAKA